MPYHDCQYLYLSKSEAIINSNVVTWENIPTLSLSSRECYISVASINIVFTSNQAHSDIIVKGTLPTMNYKSTDNSDPILAILHSTDSKVFDLNIENPIHLFSNDNIKNFKMTLTKSNGNAATPSACHVLLKIDYVDQEKQQESFLMELPKRI